MNENRLPARFNDVLEEEVQANQGKVTDTAPNV